MISELLVFNYPTPPDSSFVFSKQRRSLGLELLLARVYRALRQLHREVYIWDVLILIDGGVFGAG